MLQSGPEFGGQAGGNHTMLEIMIPGNKVGLVIGKGGETIKQLQVTFQEYLSGNILKVFGREGREKVF